MHRIIFGNRSVEEGSQLQEAAGEIMGKSVRVVVAEGSKSAERMNVDNIHRSGVKRAMLESLMLGLIIARMLELYRSLSLGKSREMTGVSELKSQDRSLDINKEVPKNQDRRDHTTAEESNSPTEIVDGIDFGSQEKIPSSMTVIQVKGSDSRIIGESSVSKEKMLTGSNCVRLVTSWCSPFAHRVAISLRQKGVQYVTIEENVLNKNERTLNGNPLNKRIPILMHNGRTISESRIIIEYIDEAWPESPAELLPKDPFERSAARYWGDYIDMKIVQMVLRHIGVNAKDVYDNIIDAMVGLNRAMTLISHGQSFFLSDQLGFVDIMFAPIIPWLQVLQKLDNFQMPNAQQCPRLHQWFSALQNHPNVKPSLQASSPKRLKDFIVNFRKTRK